MHIRSRYCSKKCKDAFLYAKHAEKRRVQQAEYRETNKTARSAYDKARRESDPEAHRARLRAYYEEHKLVYMQARDRRRSVLRGFEVVHYSEADWRKILYFYRNACAYCGSTDRIEREHVIPVTRGGRDAIGNVVPACFDCNRSKHSKFRMEWKLHQRKLEGLAA